MGIGCSRLQPLPLARGLRYSGAYFPLLVAVVILAHLWRWPTRDKCVEASGSRDSHGFTPQVQLKDEDTDVASVFVQVHSAEALKMLGL